MSNKNGMALVRTEKAKHDALDAAIRPFMPEELRAQWNGRQFLRMAAQQLEGKDFQPATLYTALVTFAMAGIMPNAALGHGYLVPYKGKITPVFGYKGYQELARRAAPSNGARLLDIRTDVVLDGDVWDDVDGYECAIKRHRKHRDRDPRIDPGNALIGAYCIAEYVMPLPGSAPHVYSVVEWMSAGEVKAVMAASSANGPDSPKKKWPLRMMQKAPVRRLCASGRVPLGYLAGAVIAAEQQADAGRYQEFLATLRQQLPDRAESNGGLIQGMIDDAEVQADDEPFIEPWAKYADLAAPVYERLRSASCGLPAADQHMRQLAAMREECGLARDARDEIADGLYEQIRHAWEREQ